MYLGIVHVCGMCLWLTHMCVSQAIGGSDKSTRLQLETEQQLQEIRRSAEANRYVCNSILVMPATVCFWQLQQYACGNCNSSACDTCNCVLVTPATVCLCNIGSWHLLRRIFRFFLLSFYMYVDAVARVSVRCAADSDLDELELQTRPFSCVHTSGSAQWTTYIYSLIHSFIHTQRHTHIYIHTSESTCIALFIHLYIHKDILTYIHTYIRVNVVRQILTWISAVDTTPPSANPAVKAN